MQTHREYRRYQTAKVYRITYNQSKEQGTDTPLISASRYAQAMGCSTRTAQRRIRQATEDGILSSTDNVGFDKDGNRIPARRQINTGIFVRAERAALKFRRERIRTYWRNTAMSREKGAAIYAAAIAKKSKASNPATGPVIRQEAKAALPAPQDFCRWEAEIQSMISKKPWMTPDEVRASFVNSRFPNRKPAERQQIIAAMKAATTYDNFVAHISLQDNMKSPPQDGGAFSDDKITFSEPKRE